MFIKRHANELQDCIAVLNTDNGAGRPRGWYVNGRKDLRDAMRPIAERLRDLPAVQMNVHFCSKGFRR